MINILTELSTIRLGNKLWVLSEDFVVNIDGVCIEVPKGFVTDGASGPRLLWTICSPIAGPFGEAAVIHDFLYNKLCSLPLNKKFADQVLADIGMYRGASWLNATMVQSGVHLFGHRYYKVPFEKLSTTTCYNFERATQLVTDLRKETPWIQNTSSCITV